jgi:hypothetical protein
MNVTTAIRSGETNKHEHNFYLIVWLILPPFRIVGIAIGGALSLVLAIR